MKTLTTEQMREADRRCIEDLGIPGVVLMNNAGQAVFQEVSGGPVGIVCGKGNNGGDGYVVARLALTAGFAPHVVTTAAPESFTGDAAVFMNSYRKLGGEIEVVQSEEEAQAAMKRFGQCSVLVDALLGTGTQGEVRGVARALIDHWPDIVTVAVDMPSGLNADTGEICGCCVKATTTVTFQYAKRGFENPHAKEYLGRLVVADIGIPEICADDDAWRELMGA